MFCNIGPKCELGGILDPFRNIERDAEASKSRDAGLVLVREIFGGDILVLVEDFLRESSDSWILGVDPEANTGVNYAKCASPS